MTSEREKKLYETVAANPVDLNIEFDGGDSHGHSHGAGLQRTTISLPEGQLAVRLPFGPDECTLEVSFIEKHDRIISLATF